MPIELGFNKLSAQSQFGVFCTQSEERVQNFITSDLDVVQQKICPEVIGSQVIEKSGEYRHQNQLYVIE